MLCYCFINIFLFLKWILVKNKDRPATIIDVAKIAGVSPKTVSRALTGNGYVSNKTLQRVKQAADQLGYRVNRAAQSLVSARSSIIGLIVPTVSNPFFPEVFTSIQETALANNYTVSVFETLNRPDLERRAINLLNEHRAAGLIVYIPQLSDEDLQSLLQHNSATVLIGHNSLRELAGLVRVDLHDAAVQAVNHLVDIGRHHIAYLDIETRVPQHVNLERVYGLREAMDRHQLAIEPKYFIYCDGTMTDARHRVEIFLKEHSEIDSIICHHDMLAYGALEACDSLHISVPDQVAVVGFDDISLSSLKRISLTTLQFPKAEIGGQAVQMLIKRIEGDLSPMEVVLKTKLIQRGSTLS